MNQLKVKPRTDAKRSGLWRWSCDTWTCVARHRPTFGWVSVGSLCIWNRGRPCGLGSKNQPPKPQKRPANERQSRKVIAPQAAAVNLTNSIACVVLQPTISVGCPLRVFACRRVSDSLPFAPSLFAKHHCTSAVLDVILTADRDEAERFARSHPAAPSATMRAAN